METHFPNIEATYGGMARERVVAELQALIREAEALLQASVRTEGAAEARAQLARAIQRARATCAKLQGERMAALQSAAARTHAVIQEHPYPAVGIAFGLGVLVGLLATRR